MKKKWTIKAVKEHYQKKIKRLLYEFRQSQVVINDLLERNTDLNKYSDTLSAVNLKQRKDCRNLLNYIMTRQITSIIKVSIAAQEQYQTDYWELPEDDRADTTQLNQNSLAVKESDFVAHIRPRKLKGYY